MAKPAAISGLTASGNTVTLSATMEATTGNPDGSKPRLSLSEAAEFLGVHKGTLSKDRQKGRVSAHRDDQGRLWFERAELLRAYPSSKPFAVAGNVADGNESDNWQPPSNAVLEQMTARIEELKTDKDDLRRQLAEERERHDRERQELLGLLRQKEETMKLLTDQRLPPAPAAPELVREPPTAPSKPRGIWGWLRGK
jgi:hypothetical protein